VSVSDGAAYLLSSLDDPAVGVRVMVMIRVRVRGGGVVCSHTHICTNHYKGYGMLHQRDVRKGSDLQR